ncbi:unnamed protein product [Agarophyton chilense]
MPSQLIAEKAESENSRTYFSYPDQVVQSPSHAFVAQKVQTFLLTSNDISLNVLDELRCEMMAWVTLDNYKSGPSTSGETITVFSSMDVNYDCIHLFGEDVIGVTLAAKPKINTSSEIFDSNVYGNDEAMTSTVYHFDASFGEYSIVLVLN